MGEEAPAWAKAMWSELNAMSDVEQIQAAGKWITYMTNTLLSELGTRRRVTVVEVLARPGWDASRLAEELGSRRTAIQRLAEHGRAILRQRGVTEAGQPVRLKD